MEFLECHNVIQMLLWLCIFGLGYTQDINGNNEQPLCQIKLGIILPYKGNHLWTRPKTEPAIQYAIEGIQNRTDLSALDHCEYILNWGDSNCSEILGPLVAIDMYYKNMANVFVGPACDYAVAPISRFSPFWNIPIITGGALVEAFSQKKTKYKLLTRVSGSYEKLAQSLIDLFDKYQWSNVSLIYHDNLGENAKLKGKSSCFFTLQGVFRELRVNYIVEPYSKHFDETDNTTDFKKILSEASERSRIVVLCASPDSVRQIMLTAAENNFNNGE
ncbi:unnamed protein product, partial [Owenia fusiformis]